LIGLIYLLYHPEAVPRKQIAAFILMLLGRRSTVQSSTSGLMKVQRDRLGREFQKEVLKVSACADKR